MLLNFTFLMLEKIEKKSLTKLFHFEESCIGSLTKVDLKVLYSKYKLNVFCDELKRSIFRTKIVLPFRCFHEAFFCI